MNYDFDKELDESPVEMKKEEKQPSKMSVKDAIAVLENEAAEQGCSIMDLINGDKSEESEESEAPEHEEMEESEEEQPEALKGSDKSTKLALLISKMKSDKKA